MDIKQLFQSRIKNAQKILITTHIFPDADGIGSEISLALALKRLGKSVLCVNEKPLLERYEYLAPSKIVFGIDELTSEDLDNIDLMIVVDTNTVARAGKKMMNLAESKQIPVLYIDHHPCPEIIKKNNCIDTTYAATGQVVGELILSLGIEFDQQMALPIYTAILIDTSSFRYPTVSADTHRLIAMLMDTGVEPPIAYNQIYGTKKVDHMHLLASVLRTADTNKSGKVAWITITKETLEKYDVDIEDTHAFINHLLVLDGIEVACMFRDDGHQVKVSLRSPGNIDVGIIATGIGGGGHSHSAATIISNTKDRELSDIISDTIFQIETIMISKTQ